MKKQITMRHLRVRAQVRVGKKIGIDEDLCKTHCLDKCEGKSVPLKGQCRLNCINSHPLCRD